MQVLLHTKHITTTFTNYIGSNNHIYNYSKNKSKYLQQELDIQKEMKNHFDKNIKYKKKKIQKLCKYYYNILKLYVVFF